MPGIIGADGRTRTADLLITNWFRQGSTDVHRRPGTYTGQGVGAAPDSAGVYSVSRCPPPLLSRLLSILLPWPLDPSSPGGRSAPYISKCSPSPFGAACAERGDLAANRAPGPDGGGRSPGWCGRCHSSRRSPAASSRALTSVRQLDALIPPLAEGCPITSPLDRSRGVRRAKGPLRRRTVERPGSRATGPSRTRAPSIR